MDKRIASLVKATYHFSKRLEFRFQHPVQVASNHLQLQSQGIGHPLLTIADTYKNKLKRVNSVGLQRHTYTGT